MRIENVVFEVVRLEESDDENFITVALYSGLTEEVVIDFLPKTWELRIGDKFKLTQVERTAEVTQDHKGEAVATTA